MVHLTEDGDRQQSLWREPFDDRLVKTGVPEQVTDNDIAWRPIGESAVEIQHVEPAAVADPTTLRPVTGETHRYRRNVNSIDREPSRGEPDSRRTTSARDIDRVSRFREQMLVGGEHSWRTESAMGREALAGVLRIPVHAILLGHSPNLEADPGLSRRRGVPTPPGSYPDNQGDPCAGKKFACEGRTLRVGLRPPPYHLGKVGDPKQDQ